MRPYEPRKSYRQPLAPARSRIAKGIALDASYTDQEVDATSLCDSATLSRRSLLQAIAAAMAAAASP